MPISSVSPVVVWERQFDHDHHADMAWDVVETPEGDLIVVGTTGPTPCQLGCDWDGLVVKVDSQGNRIWSRQFGGRGADLFTSVIQKGAHCIIAGSKYVFPYARQAWLLEISPDGGLVWEKTLGGVQDDSATAVVALPDGGLLMVGQTRSFGVGDGKSDVWLVRLDADRDVLWTRALDLGHEDMGTSIVPFRLDQFVVSAVSCTHDCGGLLQQGFAAYLVVDSAGSALRTERFTEGPKNKLLKARHVRDGGTVMVGATSMWEQFPSEDTWVMKLDANGDLSWSRIIASRGRYDGAHDIVETSTGGYVVAAYSQVVQTPEMDLDNFCILGLGGGGDILWTRSWGGPWNDDLMAVTPTLDGALVFAGFRDAVSWPLNAIPGPADFYVTKVMLSGYGGVFLPLILAGNRSL